MYYRGVNYLVVGLSKSGASACRLLLELGANCYIYDDFLTEKTQRVIQELTEKGAIFIKKEQITQKIGFFCAVVLSPGIPIDHEISLLANQRGVRVMGELELGSLFCQAPIVAVTGTNGKTTTVTMIHEILTECGFSSALAGNIGTPLSSIAKSLTTDDVAVVETSSFQLETIHTFLPHISVLLNVTPDHINRHYSLENYEFLKGRIFNNQRESEYAVISADDEASMRISNDIKAKKVLFSLDNDRAQCLISSGNICFFSKPVMKVCDLKLRQMHNVYNALAAISVAKLLGADNDGIYRALSRFRGPRHRIEWIRTINGISYYNDSKATNVDASIKAIASMDCPTVVILGGKDKGYDYDDLFRAILQSQVVHAVITGETRAMMVESATRVGFHDFTVCDNFEKSVRIASMQCKDGGAVLLSPAASSFDQFSGYEERGDVFTEIVEGLC